MDTILGLLDQGLSIAQTFTNDNRIRRAASGCGAAQFCIDRSVEFNNNRKVFNKCLSISQAIQLPLVKLLAHRKTLRVLISQTAIRMNTVIGYYQRNGGIQPPVTIERELGHKISMYKFYTNRLCTHAADRAIQIQVGNGYSAYSVASQKKVRICRSDVLWNTSLGIGELGGNGLTVRFDVQLLHGGSFPMHTEPLTSDLPT
jgi:alkylation response protein AidB-like acyl-CoA dehydrogenase